MKRQQLLFALSLLTFCSRSNSGIFEQRRLLLFVDTTQSLSSAQSEQTAKLTRELLHGNGDYSDVTVYPIGAANQAPVPVIHQSVMKRVSARRSQLQQWDSHLDEMFEQHKAEAHTCILDSVEFASRQLSTEQTSTDSPTNLALITDMIEDCPSTPFGRPIRLEKTTIKRLTELASHFPQGKIKLPNAKVFIVIPPGYNPGPRDPRIEDLEQFWRVFLSRCIDTKKTELIISRSILPPGL